MPDFDYANQIQEIYEARKNRDTIDDSYLDELADKFTRGKYSICTPFNSKTGELATEEEVKSNNVKKIKEMNKFIHPPAPADADVSADADVPADADVSADAYTAALFLQLCGNNYFLSEEIFTNGILKDVPSGESGASGGKRNRNNKKRTKRLLSNVSRIASVKHKKEEKHSTKITNRISQNAKSTLKK